jgi:hypothetical protein
MHESTKQLVGLARWWARTRDMPVRFFDGGGLVCAARAARLDVCTFDAHKQSQNTTTTTLSCASMQEVLLLYGWLGFALGLGVYSAKEVYFSSAAGR